MVIEKKTEDTRHFICPLSISKWCRKIFYRENKSEFKNACAGITIYPGRIDIITADNFRIGALVLFTKEKCNCYELIFQNVVELIRLHFKHSDFYILLESLPEQVS